MSRAALYVLPVHGKPSAGIPIEILREPMYDQSRSLTGPEIARELGLNFMAGRQAVNLLNQVGYLRPQPADPQRFELTQAGRAIFDSPPMRDRLSRTDALNAALDLLMEAGQGNTQEAVCRIAAMTFFGGLLDAHLDEVSLVSAQVTVRVARDAGAAVADHMRALERRLLGVDPALDLHLVLVPG